MSDQSAEGAVHPIQVVSKRTGLRADVIRAWERRYGAVAPSRSETGRRMYTGEDVERLALLGRATRSGRRIGDVARLELPALRNLVDEDERAAAVISATAPSPKAGSEVDLVDVALADVAGMDAAALEHHLFEASVKLTIPIMLDGLISPLFRRIGREVRAGRLRIAHEHMATAVARSFLGALRATADPSQVTGPHIIVATPAGQVHELGALMGALAAASQGWRVIYLGPDLPADEIAAAATQTGAGVIALSIMCAEADPRLREELLRLRRHLPDAVIFAGGVAAESGFPALQEIEAQTVNNFAEFRVALDAARLTLAS